MNTPRVDIYTGIHKALRFRMYETGALLGASNFADSTEKKNCIESVKTTMGFFDEHLGHEDKHVEPVLKAAAPALAASLDVEHRSHEAIAEEINSLVALLEDASPEASVGVGAQLYTVFNEMIGEQAVHMNKEERDGNVALWSAHTDEFLGGLRAAIQADIAPPRFLEWLAIMLPQFNHQELVGMFTGIKLGAPPPVYDALSGAAKGILKDRWPAVDAALPPAP